MFVLKGPDCPKYLPSYGQECPCVALLAAPMIPSDSQPYCTFATMANYADLSTSHLVVELANRGLRKSGIKSDLVSRLEEDDKKKNSTLHRISGHTLGLSAGHIPYLPVESLIEEISRNNYSRNDPKYQHIKAEAETFLKVLKLTNDRDEVVEDVNSTWRAGVKEILDQRDIDLKAINNLKLLEVRITSQQLSAVGFLHLADTPYNRCSAQMGSFQLIPTALHHKVPSDGQWG